MATPTPYPLPLPLPLPLIRYGAPERGAVPIGWTVPAAAVQLLPTILSWLTKQATANDTFVAGAEH